MIMLDTNHCLSFDTSPLGSPLTGEDLETLGLRTDHDRHVYHSLKEVLQLKLQQRRTREELVGQGIMPPLKSPAAFHEQRKSLERARTEDYLKRKIRSRPERSELVRMHILEETSAEPSLQAKQLQLKRARLADDLNDKISHRPGPIELVHKNILPVICPLQQSLLDSPKGAGGESSSLDEDSSDALSPDQLTNHDSPLGPVPQLSPSHMLTQSGDMSPTQFFTQPPPPPPTPPPPPPTPPPPNPTLMNGLESSPPQKLTNGTATPVASRSGQAKAKPSSERPPHRPKKPKDNKPKVKKLKYHQYIPPDQKADKEPPPQLDSSYAKILQQQQLFLQLQILNQQQQHYNYHTILPAPPKPPAEQPPSTNPGPSPSRSVPTTTTPSPSNQSGSRQSQTPVGGAKPSTLPANLDEFKVAELKLELKLRGLTVSGTKNDLIERLRNYQEHHAGSATAATPKHGMSQPVQQGACQSSGAAAPAPTGTTVLNNHQSGEGGVRIASFSLAQTAIPGRVMRFGSTSSSPPASPSPSERSLAAMSPDETSCSGDMFGEMVSSPLTQLTLHPSPQHPSTAPALSQPLAQVKEENQGQLQSSCSLSRPSPASGQPAEPSAGVAMETSSLDKDQMLQEKDKQIEELTRRLRQKQRLVETLRSQLEQGKMVSGGEKEGRERSGTTGGAGHVFEVKPQTLIKASAIQPPTLPNGMLVRVKREVETEVETEDGMEGVFDESQARRPAQPTQCSQETLLKLQQIHRLQVQQAEQQKHLKQQQLRQQQIQMQQQKVPQTQQKTQAQILLQQQQLQQLIIQQTQQKHLQAQQKLAQQRLAQQKLAQQTLAQEKLAQQKLAQEKLAQQKLAQEKLAQQKLAQEKLAQQKLAQEKLAQQKLAQEKLAQHKLAQEKLAQQKLAQEKLAQQRLAQEKLAQQKLAQETLAQEMLAQEMLAQEKLAQEKLAQETLAQQKLAQEKLAQETLAQQKLVQQKLVQQQNQLKLAHSLVLQAQQNQQKNQVQLKQVQVQNQTQTAQTPKPAVSQAQLKKQQRVQQRQQLKQQQTAATTQQVTPVFMSQQNGTQHPGHTISLDLLKSNGTPTLVTDSNGNHYLIALTNHTAEGQNGVSSLGKTNGRITLQRLQSTPSKLPSQSATETPNPASQSKPQLQPEPVSQPIKKVQKAGLHLETNGAPEPSLSISAPPSLQPFFDDLSDSESQSAILPSLKENGLSSQQMDDLFDILLKSGEISGFRANPDPSLAHLHSNPPSPASPPSPLHLSPPTPPEPASLPAGRQHSPAGNPCGGSARLEDFLESTAGGPLLGVEANGDLRLIDDLHSHMLSTRSLLEHHPPSPMDTSDLGFSPHPAGLDFGDPTLDSMDWLDISMVGSAGGAGGAGDGGTSLAPLAPHTPPSVFSDDFLDSTDLQLHWDSCL